MLISILITILIPFSLHANDATDKGEYTFTQIYTLKNEAQVRGTILKINETEVYQFLGIPFALSPLNTSRFGTPKPATKWPDLYNATFPARACMQAYSERGFENKYYNLSKNDQSEDCLQLNMWVPQPISGESSKGEFQVQVSEPKDTKNEKKGVLVFIFGGGFRFGSPSLDIYNGSVLAAKTGLIVVNLNYRLGILGFAYMSKGDNVTGNMGLLDQQMGLKWVHENIEKFGGDPNNVTLWGEGSGAICASAHLFSKGSENYFQKLILMSGSINSLLAAKEPSFVDSITRQTALQMDCFKSTEQKNHKEIFECLIQKNASELMQASEKFSIQVDMPTILGENIILNDTYFFNGSLYFKLLTGKIKKNVDVLFGMPIRDGAFYLPILKDSKKYGCVYDKVFSYDENTCQFNASTYYNFYNLTRVTLRLNDSAFDNVINKWYYVTNDTQSMRENATRFLTDVTGGCHLIDFARKVSTESHGTFYNYYFNASSSTNKWPTWMKSTHGDELDYAFGLPFRYPDEYNTKGNLEEEKMLSEKIMNMIKKFTQKKGFYSTWDKFTDSYRRGTIINRNFDPENIFAIVYDIEPQECRELMPFLPKYLKDHGDLKAIIQQPDFNDTDFKDYFYEGISYRNESYYYSGNEDVYYEAQDDGGSEPTY
uniref:Acetylcholinesterase n=1 Tax=Parastrongyloides trichosuri TaxID=131310 RepID=A0A0N5A4D2_PARTI